MASQVAIIFFLILFFLSIFLYAMHEAYERRTKIILKSYELRKEQLDLTKLKLKERGISSLPKVKIEHHPYERFWDSTTGTPI